MLFRKSATRKNWCAPFGREQRRIDRIRMNRWASIKYGHKWPGEYDVKLSYIIDRYMTRTYKRI
jgi:hypothetical protein